MPNYLHPQLSTETLYYWFYSNKKGYTEIREILHNVLLLKKED